MSAQISIIMGSKNDLTHLKSGIKLLNEFNVSYEVHVMSAHRTPERVVNYIKESKNQGTKIFICAAGMAAHLAGVVAAHTICPVIGIPLSCEPFNGLDALLATVQMPPGIPVATVTAGSAGSKNAALLAVSILALNDACLAQKLQTFRIQQTEMVIQADQEIQDQLNTL